MASDSLPAPTAYHRLPIRALNKVLAAANKAGLAKVDLSADTLMREAREDTGLSHFGDDGFCDRLEVLSRSLRDEARLNPIGQRLQKQAIVRILKHRLYAEDWFTRHPEILDCELADPIVVMGLARSGTTRLHRLLASDPRFLHLKAWESINPVPWPECQLPPGNDDPRIQDIDRGLKAVLYMSPQIASVHPLGTLEVEEEVGLIQHGISSQLFEVQARIPGFANYLMAHDQDDAYRYMLKLLKLISWQRGDDTSKPWVLKTPQHMQDLDALMRVFPKAKLIFSHRDPVKVIGSICSMTWNSMVRDTDTLDPHWIGEEWLNKAEQMLTKVQALRQQHIPAGQCLDVHYRDLSDDWQSVMQDIYHFIAYPLEPALPSMSAWLASNAQHKHGVHRYQLSDFGLSEQVVENRLGYYRDAYSIAKE